MKSLLYLIAFIGFISCNNKSSKTEAKENAGGNATEAVLNTADEAKSLYLFDGEFEDQSGKKVELSELKGKPVVVSMIYTTCKAACPRIISDIKKIESSLGDKKNDVNYLLISFDSDFDSPEVLKEYGGKHNLGKGWTLLKGDEETVRTLSVLLDISYAKTADQVFSHDNKIIVLDQNGVIRYQEEGLGNPPDKVNSAITQLLRS